MSLNRRTSVDEPILLHSYDSVSVCSEVELADTTGGGTGTGTHSPLGQDSGGLDGGGGGESDGSAFSHFSQQHGHKREHQQLGDKQPQGASPRRSGSSKAPGFATIAEEGERLDGGGFSFGFRPANGSASGGGGSLAGSPRGSAGSGRGGPGSLSERAKPLSLLPLIALIFYDVSGGPFGIEDAVSKGAPLLAVLGFIILPLVWSVPEALVTAELATTFPENSGYVAWVTAAFGPFWGFQKGLYAWVSGVTDNAVYPVLFLNYLQEVAPVLEDYWARLVFLLAFNLALTYLNYRGLHVVGEVAIGMTAFTLLPFVVMCLLGLPHVRPSNWLVVDWGEVQWLPFLNIMFWNLNYWDSVSCLAGEVQNPSKTFPRALAGAVVLVVAAYLLPLLVGLGVTARTADWELGYFAAVGQTVGGKWLAWWIVAAAAVSQIGQFEAEMSSDSFQLQGMAERGFLPALFNKRSKHGTPVYAILASSVGIMGMASFDFIQIVELLNCVYCMGQLLEFFAFLWLRVRYPSLHRPYRIPLPTWACACMLGPACLLLAGLVVVPWVMGDVAVIAFTFGTVAVGAALHPLLQLARQRGWIAFEGTTPLEFKEMLYTMYVPPDEEATPAPPLGGSSINATAAAAAAAPTYVAAVYDSAAEVGTQPPFEPGGDAERRSLLPGGGGTGGERRRR
ncbi:hypothetical protein D9Q98_002451 [Chlorella vulgaris]|uniref:Polyamine transporter n=1 Tax=Chlorella vulgaris TaxID=3077 RepID=A0A9D4TTD3_CHLVU|nr:hypothetical protein D9Q98_002451 [Chlorella vulgaris]